MSILCQIALLAGIALRLLLGLVVQSIIVFRMVVRLSKRLGRRRAKETFLLLWGTGLCLMVFRLDTTFGELFQPILYT